MVFLRRQRLQAAEEPPALRLLAVRTVHQSPLIPGLPLIMAGQPRMMMAERCAILGKHLPLPVTGK